MMLLDTDVLIDIALDRRPHSDPAVANSLGRKASPLGRRASSPPRGQAALAPRPLPKEEALPLGKRASSRPPGKEGFQPPPGKEGFQPPPWERGLPALKDRPLKASRRIAESRNGAFSQSARSNGWNNLAPVLPVEPEIAVQRQDYAFRMQFRHTHKTAVSQGHGGVAVLVKQV